MIIISRVNQSCVKRNSIYSTLFDDDSQESAYWLFSLKIEGSLFWQLLKPWISFRMSSMLGQQKLRHCDKHNAHDFSLCKDIGVQFTLDTSFNGTYLSFSRRFFGAWRKLKEHGTKESWVPEYWTNKVGYSTGPKPPYCRSWMIAYFTAPLFLQLPPRKNPSTQVSSQRFDHFCK